MAPRQAAHRMVGWLVLGVSTLALFGLACNPKKSKDEPGKGAYIDTKADLQPDGNPGSKAQMVLAGTVIPVDLKVVPKNDRFAIDLMYNGELFEEELYQNGQASFGLVNAAGETYSPPIPLLKFPMHVGDTLKWEGTMLTGPAGRKAQASIHSRDDRVDMGGTQTDALLVEVELEISSGANVPANRRLAFWFVKGKGIVKREFGLSTSRVPAGAKTK